MHRRTLPLRDSRSGGSWLGPGAAAPVLAGACVPARSGGGWRWPGRVHPRPRAALRPAPLPPPGGREGDSGRAWRRRTGREGGRRGCGRAPPCWDSEREGGRLGRGGAGRRRLPRREGGRRGRGGGAATPGGQEGGGAGREGLREGVGAWGWATGGRDWERGREVVALGFVWVVVLLGL